MVGEGGLLPGLIKMVLEGALEAELTDRLGYEKGDKAGTGSANSRNGTSRKTVRTEVGPVALDIPRDRAGGFTPQIIPKHRRRVDGFDAAILSLYAKGLTTGEIQAHLAEIYDMDVSRDLVSRVTDKVVGEMTAWQSRPLDRTYAVLLIDALVVKIRDGAVANRPVYVDVGVTLEGERDVLGMWVGTGGEGAKTWMTWLAELRNRGVEDVLMACCDGLKGLPESITNIWPLADVQLCVVHMVRASLRFASKKGWGAIAKDLRNVYTAPTGTRPSSASPRSRPNGDPPTRPWSRCGGATGSTSSSSCASHRRSAASSTPPTPSSPSTPASARPYAAADTSPTSRPP